MDEQWICAGFIVSILLFVVLVPGCLDTSTIISRESDGMVVQMNTGDTFLVSFHENPSIPLRWQVNTSPGLTVTRTGFRSDISIADMMGMAGGGGGTKTWDVQVIQPGTWPLEINQVRLNPASNQSAIVQTIRVTIVATDRA